MPSAVTQTLLLENAEVTAETVLESLAGIVWKYIRAVSQQAFDHRVRFVDPLDDPGLAKRCQKAHKRRYWDIASYADVVDQRERKETVRSYSIER